MAKRIGKTPREHFMRTVEDELARFERKSVRSSEQIEMNVRRDCTCLSPAKICHLLRTTS